MKTREQNGVKWFIESSFLLHLSQGSFLVIQAVAQALVACGAPKGSIVTVGSIVGKVRYQQAHGLYFTVLIFS